MNRIKEILEKKGVKQTWLAKQLDKSYNMVNSYVQNRRQPSLDDLYKIANILSVDVRDLLSENIQQKEFNTNSIHDNIATPIKTINIPLLGSIACGIPILAVENIETEIPVSIDLIKGSNKYFILKARGDSMNEKGINDGDLVLVKQQNTANNGDTVVALIDDEATIKELRINDKNVLLLPRSSNKKHTPVILSRNFIVQGVVVSIIPKADY